MKLKKQVNKKTHANPEIEKKNLDKVHFTKNDGDISLSEAEHRGRHQQPFEYKGRLTSKGRSKPGKSLRFNKRRKSEKLVNYTKYKG